MRGWLERGRISLPLWAITIVIAALTYRSSDGAPVTLFFIPALLAGWFLPLRNGLLFSAFMLAVRVTSPGYTFAASLGWPMLIELLRLTQYPGQVLFAHYASRQSRTVKAISEASIYVLLNAIHARDQYTGTHSVHVALYARAIGKELGLSPAETDLLFLGGLLHDVGKIAVREDVLNNPGRLTPSEYDEMKTHPARGIEIVRLAPALAPLTPIILHHHERLDGKGYPHGLTERQIPLFARICAAADTFDAMTTDRPYRKAYNPGAALAEMEQVCGTQLDGSVVAALKRVLTRRQFTLASQWREATALPVSFQAPAQKQEAAAGWGG